jgi:hypothetical protein
MRRPMMVLALERSDDRVLAMSKVKARAAALVVVAGLASTTADAVEQPKLTLACEGTYTDKTMPDAKLEPMPISMYVIVDFTAGTVEGFGFPGATKIIHMNEVTITFSGSDPKIPNVTHRSLAGTVDRVTGVVEAFSALFVELKIQAWTDYWLKCRPTQRMF